MKRLIQFCLLALMGSPAWAVSFVGTYNVSVNTGGSGLIVNAQPGSGSLNFNLNDGESTSTTLFRISTPESDVAVGEDTVPVPASIAFNFTSPTSFGGTATGQTYGSSQWVAFLQVEAGNIRWSNGGSVSMGFNGGVLDVQLTSTKFNEGLFGLGSTGASVKGKFTYRAGAVSVPEPGTLSLLGAGLLAFGLTSRRRRTQKI